MNNTALINRGEVGNRWTFSFPDKKKVQAGLLVLTVALAAISLLPSLSFEASLAFRSAAFLSTAVLSASNWSEGRLNRTTKLATITKLAAIALGIGGLAAGLPQLTTISLALSASISAVELMKNMHDKKMENLPFYIGLLVIKSLMLTAALTGSWQLLTAVTATSSFFMGMMALKTLNNAKDNYDRAIGISYIMLSILGFSGGAKIAKITWDSNEPTPPSFPNYSKQLSQEDNSVIVRP
ncbi:MAG: hypothetical protein WAM28_07515 [Chlamydiales bacterium]